MIPLDHSIRHNLSPQALRGIGDAIAERQRQDAKWGVQNHDPITWIAILTEEVGEAAQEALSWRFSPAPDDAALTSDNFRAEMVQVAAVALAIVECMDRGQWLWPGTLESTVADLHI